MARGTTAKKKASNKITVDFTGVESGSGGMPSEGDHTFAVQEISTEDGNAGEYLKWTFKVISAGKDKGRVAWHNTSLTPQSLWSLRGLLEIMGFEVPDGPLDLDFDEIIGTEVGGTIEHEEWEKDKFAARIVDFFDPNTGEVAEHKAASADEAPATSKAKKTDKAASKLAKVKASELDDLGEEELAAMVEKYKLEIDLDEHPTLRKKKNAVLDALETGSHLIED